MPYFNELHQAADELTLWADLRHEQNAPAKSIVRRAHSALRRAIRDLKQMSPPKTLVAREPIDLEGVRRLRPEGPRRLWTKLRSQGLKDRIKGAWLGRAAGCTLGAPVEGWTPERMEDLARQNGQEFPPTEYWSAHPDPAAIHYGGNAVRDYLKGGIHEIPVDDDLTYTILGLLILERFGVNFTTADVGAAWLDWVPIACTAEHVALENLRAGVRAEQAADRKNPMVEWIGADIRSDPWAYAAPGWPEKAAEMAYRDAYLSSRRTGTYAAMFFAASIAAAFAVDSPMEAVEIGLSEVPKDSRFAHAIQWALEKAPQLRNWREARAAVDEHFKGMHIVHAANNACLTIFGLALGGGDFTKTIGTTVAMGLDNDCTAATAGSILGAVIGVRGIPEQWWKPFRNRTRTYLRGHEELNNTQIVDRFVAQARRVWETR
jgi:ADP-ribosylglycohydrolase